MEPYEQIVNHKLITDWFGCWPSFHDAEVLSMHLDRKPPESRPGPSLTVRIRAFEMTSEVDDRGYYKVIKDAIIALEFDGVEEIALDGFNCQNAIWQLDIEETVNGDKQPVLGVSLSPSFGVRCDLRCGLARVKSVEPGKPDDGSAREL
jgi:hypothetical protein